MLKVQSGDVVCPLCGHIFIRVRHKPVIFAFPLCRGRGMPRPYRAIIFYYPVGRGDPTPPKEFCSSRKAVRRGQDPSLQTSHKRKTNG